jgi:hypothetical protein
MTKKALKAGGEKASTIGVYAVIDLGFDVIHDDGSTSPAGQVHRQADARERSLYGQQMSAWNPERAAEIEATLRRFGITTAGDRRSRSSEWQNLQISKSGNLIDFGAYLVEEKFEKPLQLYDPAFDFRSLKDSSTSLSEDEFYRATALLHPTATEFPQPEPEIRVPLDKWGNGGVSDPKFDRMWSRMHEIANAHRHGHMSIEQIRQELNGYLGELDEIFSRAKPRPKQKWKSFVSRIAELLRKGEIGNGVTNYLLRLINREGLILEKDLKVLMEIAGIERDSFADTRARALLMVIERLPPNDFSQVPWNEINMLLESANPKSRQFGYSALLLVMERNPLAIYEPSHISSMARWISNGATDSEFGFETRFAQVAKGHSGIREAILKELNETHNFPRLMAAIDGKNGRSVLRFISQLEPSYREENLLRAAIAKFGDEYLSLDAEALILKTKPVPHALVDEVIQAADKLTQGPNRKERMLAHVKEYAAPSQAFGNVHNCAKQFAGLAP